MSVRISATLLIIAGCASAADAQPPMKMGTLLRARVAHEAGWSEIIVEGTDGIAMEEIAPAIHASAAFAAARCRSSTEWRSPCPTGRLQRWLRIRA